MIPFRSRLFLSFLGACSVLSPIGSFAAPVAPFSTDANRLAYLDESEPFYPHRDFPKLTTPQWVGEAGVEAVVILSIDDLRETPKYETFLRPILERLKRIDGRAPVSIMINAIAPTNAQLQAWLKEGVSLEVHTLSHPCPCLAQGSFTNAANTYHGGVDLLNHVPNNRPVAFRMPCCDSMNSPSPRFYAEIFNRATPAGQFLTIDSSVMNIFTTNDPALPRDLVLDANGRERFRKYLPTQTNAVTRVSMASFTTTIEDYPYPCVIGKLCWEFPATVPSDWEAHNLHGSTNPVTLADWKAALDATVIKQGAFTVVFHPHGWSSPDQFVGFIDYAVARYGKKVKFLNFREAQERLDKNLLAGNPLRAPHGGDNGVRVLDVNNDGFMDVIIGYGDQRQTRLWDAKQSAWKELAFPISFPGPTLLGPRAETGVTFGVLHADGRATMLVRGQIKDAAFQFDGQQWAEEKSLLGGLQLEGQPGQTAARGRDQGVRFRDVNNDGRCELIVANPMQSAIFGWSDTEKIWKKLPHTLPPGTAIVDAEGRDAGLRFVDVNGDGYADALFSNEEKFSLHLFVPQASERLMWKVGWHDEVFAGARTARPRESEPLPTRGRTVRAPDAVAALAIPPIVRGGQHRNNGVWFKNQTMWVQNEDTAHLSDKVDRRTFRELLTADDPKPLSPSEALAAFRVRPGFQVELVAAEPLVQDPIAFEWGADGKLWVVEMGDYPLGLDGAGQPGGRIKFLEDTNGDGVSDKATIFLDGVNFPTGVCPWRQGVIVSAAPEIFYAEDTDGDGHADKRVTLYTGFTEGNQQHRCNGFDYGLDNWLYGANGESGGDVKPVAALLTQPATRNTSTSLRGRDFRLHPDTGAFESLPGTTQYGRHRDDWGNWFGNYNPTWLWHFFLPDHYLARNPHLAVKNTKQVLADYPVSTRLYPASRTRQRFNDHHQSGHVTSANSPTPYRDDLFGPGFASSVFISDPVHNLVHREVLEPDGVTFTSHRASEETNSEFLASTDHWFRPTMLKTGPDGALYVADMYRQVLEHPEWIPKWIQPRLDLRAGADKGRIYRVSPAGAKLRPIPRLDQLAVPELIAALDSPNGWQRDTVQRLLVHRGAIQDTAPLEKLLTSPRAKTRLQALGALDGLNALSPQILASALGDAHFAVREHAVRLTEKFAARLPADVLLKLAGDPHIRVRYQLAFTLGEWNDRRVGAALVRLALRDRDNPHLQTAVLSSATNHVSEMLTAAFLNAANEGPPAELIEKLLGLALALRQDDAIERALNHVARRSQLSVGGVRQVSGFAAFLDALDRRNESFDQFKARAKPSLRETLALLEKLFTAARLDAAQTDGPEANRVSAIRLLGRVDAHRADDIRQLAGLLRPEHSAAIQQAAVRALARLRDASAAAALLSGWRGYSPALRADALAALFSRAEWLKSLLAQIESGQFPAAELSAAHQQKLLTHSDRAIRQRAEQIFHATRQDRQAVLQDYESVARLHGDAGKGGALFHQNCATCHRFHGEGVELGPDLAGLAGKDVPALLAAILAPNQAVESRYVNYNAITKSGVEFSGLIVSENPNGFTLRSPGGKEEVLLRQDLKELASAGLSLMPDGFEKILKPQDVADLLAYLRGAAPKP